MLSQLSITNFAIVKFLELEFHAGMTTITGETGAGKSIAIDALSLCLGARGEASMVRTGANKAEVSAIFDISQIPAAQAFLQEAGLDAGTDCILRRNINQEGRSRAWINSHSVPLLQLKNLGTLLINIYGQNAHHALLNSETQRDLLDQYAGHIKPLQKCQQAHQNWQTIKRNIEQIKQQQAEFSSRQQLLEYQVTELDEFALQLDEFEQIEQDHKRLANSDALLQQSEQALALLEQNEHGSVLSLLQGALTQVAALASTDPQMQEVHQMLQESLIQTQESCNELDRYRSTIELDPEQLNHLEQRLSRAITLARKHQVDPIELANHHQQLKKELLNMSDNDDRLEQLNQELEIAFTALQQAADVLHQSRCKHATQLEKLITKNLKALAMPHARFEIEIKKQDSFTPLGHDHIALLVSTNPGQALQPLAKSASGGELSRIGLAIQVITAQKVATPTLIFDEVDVGISGPTASVVGRLLRTLGQSTQVLCVTHLPQVAGNGHHHLYVSKKSHKQSTETHMIKLTQAERLKELARLLGGDIITDNTLANASELLVTQEP